MLNIKIVLFEILKYSQKGNKGFLTFIKAVLLKNQK